ncbi:MAG: hypothetical protein F6K11_11690 [Leptolyngbya sp. SIO3F4]|nr:hypothetical protein [Leptolyngbya sp. SIO3F4]
MTDDTQVSMLPEFLDYANFSMQVDRYFNVVSIYGRHHDSIRQLHDICPSSDKLPSVDASDIDKDFKSFIWVSAQVFRDMAMTNIFNDRNDDVHTDISQNMLNFAFYTCYCFQWSLFEDFTHKMIKKLTNANVLQPTVARKLRNARNNTKKFFGIIHSGDVFGQSPFVAMLPPQGYHSPGDQLMGQVGYDELNAIRELRNTFIHRIESPEITTEHIPAKHYRYERSMWTLRKFAENIQDYVKALLDKKLQEL